MINEKIYEKHNLKKVQKLANENCWKSQTAWHIQTMPELPTMKYFFLLTYFSFAFFYFPTYKTPMKINCILAMVEQIKYSHDAHTQKNKNVNSSLAFDGSKLHISIFSKSFELAAVHFNK
jgi:hypothetical protein